MRRGFTMARLIATASLVCGAFALSATDAAAQTVTAVMTADRTEVAVGATFRLTIRADVQGGEVQRVEAPDLTHFEVLRRQVAPSMQFGFGFGQQRQMVHATTVHTYSLRARTAARYEIAGAKVIVSGQTHTTNALTIVVGGSQAAPPPSTAPNGTPNTASGTGSGAPAPPGADGARYDDQAFVRTVVSQPNPYVGQQTTVTVYLYTRRPLRSAPRVITEPTADGFWVHDLLPPTRNLDATRQVVGGVPFNAYVIRRFAAFPLRDGELSVGAPKMAIETGSLFDFFQPNQQRLEREGVAVPVQVKSLPAPVPTGDVFVGTLALELRADRTQVRTGDAVTVTLVARGSGNLRDVRPELASANGLRILQPEVEDQVELNGDEVGGVRTHQWLVVPEDPGEHRIGPMSIRAFDPDTRAYQTIETAVLTITAAGASVASADANDPSEGESVSPRPAVNAPSFGPVRRTSALSRAMPPTSAGTVFWALFALGPLAFLLFFGVRRVRRRAAADPSKVRAKDAKRRLGAARDLLGDDDAPAFYSEVARALSAAVEARVGQAIGGMTRLQLRSTLSTWGMNDELIRAVNEELESCDFARFSSAGAGRAEREECLTRVQALLGQLDQAAPEREQAA